MTEDEFILIKKIENDNQYILRQVSEIENIKNKEEIIKIHTILIERIEIINDYIKKMKSPHAIEYVSKIQYGLIEMIAYIEATN